LKKIIVSIGVIIVFLFISNECFAEKGQININVIACITKDDTIRVNKWLSEGDREAVAKEVINGTCQMLHNGTMVFIEKHGIEWAQIRQEGSNIRVWTLEKFLK
jgi:hypothetical protein